MRRFQAAVLIATTALVMALVVPVPGVAGDDETKAGTALKQAAKTLIKAKSYRVSLQANGGVSASRDHALQQRTYTGRWTGEIYKQVMQIRSLNMFRTERGGAIFDSTRNLYVSVLTDDAGTEAHRLFKFPTTVLAQAARYSQNARWMPSAQASGATVRPDPETPPTGSLRNHTTTVESSGRSKSTSSGVLPTRLRVVAPAREMVARFTEIENSGCVSGG